MGQLKNQGYFQGVYCNPADHRSYTICGVAIQTVSYSLEVTLILQPDCSDVKIGPIRSDVKISLAHALGNRL